MIRRTLRVRLTAVYAGLSVITSITLLITVNLLLEHNLRHSTTMLSGCWIGSTPPPPHGCPAPDGAAPVSRAMATALLNLPAQVLRDQWTVTGITIAVLMLASIAVGWLFAERILRPLHHITATARRLSLSNLHERIALAGPSDELTELADTFDAMLERLQRAAEAQARFVANASHELRTPLAIQRTAIQVGLDRPSAEKVAEVRDELLKLNRRNERLIDGLLILAQSEHGLDATEPVALDHLVHQVVEEIPAPDITIVQEVQPATVIGDPVLLHRLIANLVDNAIKHNHPGGNVRIQTTSDGRLTVRNTGPEIPEHRVSELFEPFRRLHATRTRSADGAGLGLSITAAITRAHNAHITAHPNPGGGLQIAVQLPRRAQPEHTAHSPGRGHRSPLSQ